MHLVVASPVMLMFWLRAINTACGVGGIVAILIGTKDPTWWQIAIAVIVALVGAALTYFDYEATNRASSKRFQQGSDDIKKYLINWIRGGGKTAIVSRNLSWVDDEAKKLLVTKAQSRDLTIYVPDETDLTKELATHGAVVHAHGQSATKARFTIINEGRGDARVAVGAGVEGDHVIDEYAAGHPVLFLAEDLVSRLAKRR